MKRLHPDPSLRECVCVLNISRSQPTAATRTMLYDRPATPKVVSIKVTPGTYGRVQGTPQTNRVREGQRRRRRRRPMQAATKASCVDHRGFLLTASSAGSEKR